MIIDKHISFIRLLKIIWKQLLAYFLLASVIIVPITYFQWDFLTIQMTTPLILGTALSIFLGFQTNSAYDRWMTARGNIGAMKSAIRNMSSILTRRRGEKYINHNTGKPSKIAAEVMPRMLRRQVAYFWLLGRQLKKKSALDDQIKAYLEPEEYESLKGSVNPALDLLLNNSKDFRIAQAEGQFFDGEHFELVGIHRQMMTIQTTSEGLRDTPFPVHYIFFSKVFIWLLIILTSLSLPKEETFSYHSILLVVLIGWFFSMILGIGSYMDEPYENNRNVVPLETAARGLEIEMLALSLGVAEEDLPKPLPPIEGAVY